MSTISSDVVYYGVSRLLWWVTGANLMWIIAISSVLKIDDENCIGIYIVLGLCIAGFNLVGITFYDFNLSNDPLTGTSVYVFISFVGWLIGFFVNLYRFHKNY